MVTFRLSCIRSVISLVISPVRIPDEEADGIGIRSPHLPPSDLATHTDAQRHHERAEQPAPGRRFDLHVQV